MTNAIDIQRVRKTFGSKVAVDTLDLAVAQGSLCGFIGPNGAGKTTTIRMIMSIIFPDQGRISVLGKHSALESKDRIGYLPEERGVYRKMKVLAFLTYMARLKGVDAGAAERKADEWLTRMALGDVRKKKCEELSKGMQQKAQFIAAVIHEPELLILDEVFSGLDPVNRRLMRDLIEEQHGLGRTIIFSTHAMYEAEQLCDQIFMIHQGQKVLDGRLSDILAQHDPHALLVEPMSSGAEAIVARLPGIEQVVDPNQKVGRGNGHPAALDVMLDGTIDESEAMAAIVRAVPVRRIERKRASLEDIFIGIVARSGGQVDADLLRASLSGSALGGGES